MPFLNRIRLPIKVSRPQFPEEREVFRKANGVSKTISVVVRKTYAMETALMPARVHERLKIALVHDTVNIENDKYLGGISQSGDYTIEWPDFQDFPVSKATTTLEVTPFNASNNNCATCEEMSQVVANDDTIPDPVGEGDVVVYNVIANDAICCSPLTLSVVSINTAYVESAIINESGQLTITMKTPLATASGVKLATYRAGCSNDSYDEADVYADIEGSEEGCTAPQNVHDAIAPGDDYHTIEWDDSSPEDGYAWELYKDSNLGLVIQQGTTVTPSVSLSMLDACTDYRFIVRAQCGPNFFSDYTQMTFSTTCPEVGCGRYEVTFNDGSAEREGNTEVYFLDCAGLPQVRRVYNLSTVFICMLQNGPGEPVQFVFNHVGISYIYVGTC